MDRPLSSPTSPDTSRWANSTLNMATGSADVMPLPGTARLSSTPWATSASGRSRQAASAAARKASMGIGASCRVRGTRELFPPAHLSHRLHRQRTAAHLTASAYFTLNSHISQLSHRLRPLDVLLCVRLLQHLSLRLAACILRRHFGCALLHRLPPREPADS